MNYHTTADIEKMIRDNKYPYFKLYYKPTNSFDAFKLIKFYKPTVQVQEPIEDTASKKSNRANEETINETVADFYNSLEIYKNKVGYIFQVELKLYEKGDTYGPFVFEMTPQSTNGLNGMQQNSQLPTGASIQEMIDFAVGKANFNNQVNLFSSEKARFEEEKKVLEKEKADFMKEVVNPAAIIGSKTFLVGVEKGIEGIWGKKLNLSGINDDTEYTKDDGERTPETEKITEIANFLLNGNVPLNKLNEVFTMVKMHLSNNNSNS